MPTEKQLKFLENLLVEKNITNEELKLLLKPYNASTLDDLDTKQASELIENLKKYDKLKEKEKPVRKEIREMTDLFKEIKIAVEQEFPELDTRDKQILSNVIFKEILENWRKEKMNDKLLEANADLRYIRQQLLLLAKEMDKVSDKLTSLEKPQAEKAPVMRNIVTGSTYIAVSERTLEKLKVLKDDYLKHLKLKSYDDVINALIQIFYRYERC